MWPRPSTACRPESRCKLVPRAGETRGGVADVRFFLSAGRPVERGGQDGRSAFPSHEVDHYRRPLAPSRVTRLVPPFADTPRHSRGPARRVASAARCSRESARTESLFAPPSSSKHVPGCGAWTWPSCSYDAGFKVGEDTDDEHGELPSRGHSDVVPGW